MPITPQFEISQTDDLVQLDIHVPHVRVSPDSLHVVLSDENRCLHFASPPYLLILTFSHAFQENAEDSCAQYDPLREHGRVALRLTKQQPGIYWDDLDMVGALMKPRSNLNQFIQKEYQQTPQKSAWIKEVLEETTTTTTGDEEDVPPQNSNFSTQNGYGFARMFHGIFTDLARDGLAREMLEIPLDEKGSILNVLGDSNCDNTQKKKRYEMEASKFESERYLQDLDIEDDYLYQNAMQMKPHWNTKLPSTAQEENNHNNNNTTYFTSQESAQLASIPYPLLPPFLKEQDQNLWLGILDLLFAYCYDHLLTDGDPTVESAWTISILSNSLSWLESFDNNGDESVVDVVSQSIRRSLIYPYLRNVDFAVFIWQQVSQIVGKGGRRCVIRCLLQIRSILDQSELYYLGNKLYIDPYLAWLQDSQRHDDEYLAVISNYIDNILSDSKELNERIGLNLGAIEREAFGETEDGGEDELSSTSSSDSESSDSEEDDSSCASGEVDNNGATTNHCPNGLETVNTVPTSVPVPVEDHSHELLDGNGEAPPTRSLIVDMAHLSINSNEDGGQCSKDVAPTKLIEEIN